MERDESDDIIETAANHLNGAMSAAGWLDAFALLSLGLGAVWIGIGLAIAVVDSDAAYLGVGIGVAIVSLLAWAVLKGFASILWLMIDRVLVSALDED